MTDRIKAKRALGIPLTFEEQKQEVTIERLMAKAKLQLPLTEAEKQVSFEIYCDMIAISLAENLQGNLGGARWMGI